MQKSMCMWFLNELDIAPETLLTPDVLDQKDFIRTFSTYASVHHLYKEIKQDFDSLYKEARQWKSSKYMDAIEKVEKAYQDCKSKLQEICGILYNPLATVMSKTRMLKRELMLEAIVLFSSSENVYNDCIQRLRVRVLQKNAETNPMPKTKEYRSFCYNDKDMSWEDGFVKISDVASNNEKLPGPLSAGEIKDAGEILRDRPMASITEILGTLGLDDGSHGYQIAVAKNIAEWFPVLVLTQGSQIMALNLHEMVLQNDILNDFLNLDLPKEQTPKQPPPPPPPPSDEPQKSDATNKSKPGPKPGKGGRPALHSARPEVVQCITDFIKQHGFAAHEKRQETTASCGVSVKQIRQHVMNSFQDVKVSDDTIRRLFVPPNKGMKSAKYYHSVIDAKVPRKVNDKEPDHPDLHYTRAQVKMAHELFALYPNEGLRISADDKNKIHIGKLAVSRYFKLRKYFPQTDSPNYPTHDFPQANTKINPSGYMILTEKAKPRSQSETRPKEKNPVGVPRSRSVSPVKKPKGKFTADKTGRFRVNFARTGPMHLYNRVTKYHPSSIQNHANDLYEIYNNLPKPDKKPAVLITVDNGPDQNIKSVKTQLYYGRLWRDLKLDVLVVNSYAAGCSSQNMIEHGWAPLSHKLAGVTIPNRLPNEDTEPWKQNIDAELQSDKEHRVFDNALTTLSSHWNNSKFDSFDVKVNSVFSTSEPSPYNDVEKVEKFLKAGVYALQADKDMRDLRHEYSMLTSHMTKKTNEIEFWVCKGNKDCKLHCGDIRAENIVGFIEKCGGIPSPTPSADPAHFKTLLEITYNPVGLKHMDENQPSLLAHHAAEHRPDHAFKCERGCRSVFVFILNSIV